MNPNPFAPAQRQTLLALRKALPDTRTVLVGAAALACQMDMAWRKTNDLDLTVVADEAELAAELRGLGWTRHERFEQRWASPQGVIVDAPPGGGGQARRRQAGLLGVGPRHEPRRVRPCADPLPRGVAR